jgi:hypothetical protein
MDPPLDQSRIIDSLSRSSMGQNQNPEVIVHRF